MAMVCLLWRSSLLLLSSFNTRTRRRRRRLHIYLVFFFLFCCRLCGTVFRPICARLPNPLGLYSAGGGFCTIGGTDGRTVKG